MPGQNSTVIRSNYIADYLVGYDSIFADVGKIPVFDAHSILISYEDE